MKPNPCLLATILHLTLVLPLFPQASPLDFERIAPQTPQTAEGTATLPSEDEQNHESADATALEELKAIILVDNADKILPEGWPAAKGVVPSGEGLIADPRLAKKLAPFLNKPATFGELRAIQAEVARFFRTHDQPVVDVRLPEQEITHGAVQFLVVEGRIGEITAEGQRWFPEGRFVSAVRANAHELIRANVLIDDMNWLNRNPFHRSDLLFRKGEDPGTTDLIIKTSDRFPIRPYIGYDNSGTEATGENRLQAGFSWGNAFGLDQIFSYQFTTSPEYDEFNAHSGTWTIPLPWRHIVEFYGSYASSEIELIGADLTAESLQVGSRYVIPLPGHGGFKHEASLGFDYKQSNNNLLFGGASVFETNTEIDQFRGGYSFRLGDSLGITGGSLALVYSPGGLTGNNTDETFQFARAFAESEYLYTRLNLQRAQKLPWNFSLLISGSAQFAGGNLLASEQFSLGGASTVRGYKESVANGDEGWLASAELRTPPVSLFKWAHLEKWTDELQFLAFYDMGGVSNVDLLPGEDAHLDLASFGAGVRYKVNTWLSVKFDYGWQLKDLSEVDEEESRAHLSVLLSY
jgi:hemolysin activation/secretion protein